MVRLPYVLSSVWLPNQGTDNSWELRVPLNLATLRGVQIPRHVADSFQHSFLLEVSLNCFFSSH